jgi:hypothetical protein
MNWALAITYNYYSQFEKFHFTSTYDTSHRHSDSRGFLDEVRIFWGWEGEVNFS